MNPMISVVIPTYNRGDRIKRTLDSLVNQDYGDYEVIVINNGSMDNTDEILASYGKGVRIIKFGVNGAVTAARNRGIRCARGSIIAFIDDDAVAPRGWLSSIVATFRRSGADAVGGVTVSKPKNSLQRYQQRFSHQVGASSGYASFLLGTNMAFKKTALMEIGCFDENFFWGSEETDLCHRMSLHGKSMYLDKKIAVEHPHRAKLWPFMKQRFGYGKGEATFLKKYHYPVFNTDDMAFAFMLLFFGESVFNSAFLMPALALLAAMTIGAYVKGGGYFIYVLLQFFSGSVGKFWNEFKSLIG